ncbi:MAG: superoxide dismutase family protein [Alphaproteobacteria bacterium]|nr:superoxide dismutase family protein [Alphaproteobacteria bacterium]
MKHRNVLAAGIAAMMALAAAGAQAAQSATAEMKDVEGKNVGTVTLTQTPHGVIMRAELKGLSSGWHGFHIHETGKCEPPFESAGGHFNPTGAEHGFKNESGPHAGDVANIHVGDDGKALAEFFTSLVTLEEGKTNLMDGDGSAIIIHTSADTYEEEPKAGDRIACGVIQG